MKWQMDVKYVPKACYTGKMPDRFYRYTMMTEVSKEWFIYTYLEQSRYSAVDFVKRAIALKWFRRIMASNSLTPRRYICRPLLERSTSAEITIDEIIRDFPIFTFVGMIFFL